MKAKLKYGALYCGECDCVLSDRGNGVVCVNNACKQFNIVYKHPAVTLKPLEEKADDSNQE